MIHAVIRLIVGMMATFFITSFFTPVLSMLIHMFIPMPWHNFQGMMINVIIFGILQGLLF